MNQRKPFCPHEIRFGPSEADKERWAQEGRERLKREFDALGSKSGAAIGLRNRKAVRAFLTEHVGATNRECAAALGLSAEAVGRHVKAIRKEWQ